MVFEPRLLASLDSVVADTLSIDKRDAGKALAALEAKNWFLVGHGPRGRSKNDVNHYMPNVEQVITTPR